MVICQATGEEGSGDEKREKSRGLGNNAIDERREANGRE